MTYTIPSYPWQMVGQDLFTLDNQNYLITVDYFSDYWELEKLPDTTSETVVKFTTRQMLTAPWGEPDSTT